jgi:hypothetical protein
MLNPIEGPLSLFNSFQLNALSGRAIYHLHPISLLDFLVAFQQACDVDRTPNSC